MRIFAHRGASADAPENTLDAFRLAVEQGADGVELDVRVGRDGSLVVHHDPDVADGRAIRDLDRGDLPADVPLLDAALDACAGLVVNVEIKNLPRDDDFDATLSVVDSVVSLLRSRDGRDDVIVSCFHLPTLDRVREVAPEIPTAFLTYLSPPAADSVPLAVRGGHATIHPHWASVDGALVDAAHAAGLAVNVWTVDDPDELRRLAGLGVDGVVTNVPAVARTVLEATPEPGPA